jgi:hypothetical protein
VQDGIAQRAAKAIEDRSVQQKALDVGGLAGDDLIEQVVEDISLASGCTLCKRNDEFMGIGSAL